MKKLLLIASSLFIGFSNINAQTSIKLTNNSQGSAIITNNSVISEDVATGAQSHVYLQLTNMSTVSVTYAIKKTEVVINPGAEAYFCWGGQCFPNTTTLTPVANYTTLTAGQVYQPQSFYYDELVAEGYSEIKYELFDVNNPNDNLIFTFKFNPLLSSVKNNSSLISSVSEAYPNPTANKATISVNATSNNNATVSITNALGSVISIKNVDLSIGKNSINLDSENLTSGIYFATITSNNNKIIKKFTINK